jgi:predicted RNase H-like HicB family nuclease
MRYAVVIQKVGETFAVHVPDVPGCVATGPTAALALREASLMIALHVEELQQGGQPVPLPTAQSGYVDVYWELNRAGLALPSEASA